MTRLRSLAGLLLLVPIPTPLLAWCGDEVPAAHPQQVHPSLVVQAATRATVGAVRDSKEVARVEPPPLVQEPANPDQRSTPAAADLARMQGVWSIDRYEVAGVSVSFKADPLVARATDQIFQGEHWMVHQTGKAMEPYAVLKLRPDTDPKQIDFTLTDGRSTAAGIYQFEEDRLLICLAEVGMPIRPTQFITKENPPTALFVCRRLGNVGPNQGPGIPPEGDKPPAGDATAPVSAPASGPDPAAAGVPPVRGDRAKGFTPKLPDLRAEQLAGLTLDQLDTLSKAYQRAFDAVLRNRQNALKAEAARGPRPRKVIKIWVSSIVSIDF